MNKKIHLWEINQFDTNGLTEVSMTLEYPDGKIRKLWYRFPAEYRNNVELNRMDAFVVATQLMAMNLGADLHVHGVVSPSLLQNLEEFRAIWHCWRPSIYKPIEIYADSEQELLRVEKPTGSVMAFSGGLDACFTAYRHATGHCRRQTRKIQAGVLINFDTASQLSEQFKTAIKKSKIMLNSLGMQLIPLSTNLASFKTLEMQEYKLLDYFLPSVISCLMLFQKSADAGLVASGAPYNQMTEPWSTHPMVDPLLSNNAFRVIHDGAAFTRTQKVKLLKDWPEALEHLQVCWYKKPNGENCGKCSKCIRTILNFRVAGVALPSCFQADITNRDILNQTRLGVNSLDSLQEILWAAQAASISDSWVKALSICVARIKFQQQYLSPIKQAFKRKLPTFFDPVPPSAVPIKQSLIQP